jgi:plasmid stabilization system protein ParE
MFKIIITQSALEEYAQIGDFIAKDNLYYAHRVLQSIDETFQTLLEFPYI